jgi:hypothetical protein
VALFLVTSSASMSIKPDIKLTLKPWTHTPATALLAVLLSQSKHGLPDQGLTEIKLTLKPWTHTLTLQHVDAGRTLTDEPWMHTFAVYVPFRVVVARAKTDHTGEPHLAAGHGGAARVVLRLC